MYEKILVLGWILLIMSLENINRNIIRLIAGLEVIAKELKEKSETLPQSVSEEEISKINKTLRSIDRSLKKIAEKMPT